jgi:cytochrome c556
MRKTVIVALIGALAAGAMVGGTTIALAQADVIKARQENRKQAAAAMKAIGEVVKAKGDAKEVVAQAAKLKTLEAAFDKMFPPGSDKGAETAALPEVWSDSAGFAAAGKNADALYDKLAAAAGSGDFAAIGAAVGAVGKEGCGGCHTKFRAKKS